MSRLLRVILIMCAVAATAVATAACGTERITASRANATTYSGAVIFSQRCAGCHTLSYAGTHGSAANIRTAEWTNGPNFDQRCERPVTRVLYAIENGGFSGLIMPQNIVVGQQAHEVAEFVATYSGHQQARAPGVPVCQSQPIGTLPPLGSPIRPAAAPPAGGKSKSKAKAKPAAKGKGKTKPGAKAKGKGKAKAGAKAKGPAPAHP